MASKTKFRFAILAAVASTALAFSGCGDDENPAPTPGAGGSKSSGGKSSGGSSSGGKADPDSGAGGVSSGGGSSSGGTTGSGGATGSGGSKNTGGVIVIPPDAGCEDDGCWSCAEKAEPKHFLNACTDSECIPYDNSGLPSPLPALP